MYFNEWMSWFFHVVRARNWVAVWACCWIAKQTSDCVFNIGADHVFPLARFVVGERPRKTKNVSEEALGCAMFTNNRFGKLFAFWSEHNSGAAQTNKTFGLHALNHFGN